MKPRPKKREVIGTKNRCDGKQCVPAESHPRWAWNRDFTATCKYCGKPLRKPRS